MAQETKHTPGPRAPHLVAPPAPRYFAWTRQLTGKAWAARAYVRDRLTGRTVAGCKHLHRGRLRSGGKNADFYARRCAKRLLARFLGSLQEAP